MSMTIKPILPRFGAEVSGIDISKPLDAEQQAAVIAAMNQWGVCVYRNTGLDNDSHIRFSQIFGYLERAPSRPGKPPRHGHRELFDAGNLTETGEILQDEALLVHKKGDRLWHTDSSFMDMRSAYSLLLAYEVPREGGQTWFADTRSAYDDLPQSMKDRIAGLEAEHSLWWSRMLAGVPLTEEEIDQRSSARHPLVLHHQGSGRDALYVAAHARDIVGMERDEGRALIRELIDWATQPQYVFSVDWNPGDLVIWDNLASMHRGGDFDERNERRDMRRTTVREGTPPAEPDDPFAVLFSAGLKAPAKADA
ncbi:MAG: taurine catabolism dioxygenase TauD, TfdA family protein [Sphingomonas bacterium]|nr:taurine catabolism dioxygenase TauD, TfdA family protein [Sphingomonas bacterium]